MYNPHATDPMDDPYADPPAPETDPADDLLGSLLLVAAEMDFGLRVEGWRLTRAQRTDLTAAIDILQRAELRAIETGR